MWETQTQLKEWNQKCDQSELKVHFFSFVFGMLQREFFIIFFFLGSPILIRVNFIIKKTSLRLFECSFDRPSWSNGHRQMRSQIGFDSTNKGKKFLWSSDLRIQNNIHDSLALNIYPEWCWWFVLNALFGWIGFIGTGGVDQLWLIVSQSRFVLIKLNFSDFVLFRVVFVDDDVLWWLCRWWCRAFKHVKLRRNRIKRFIKRHFIVGLLRSYSIEREMERILQIAITRYNAFFFMLFFTMTLLRYRRSLKRESIECKRYGKATTTTMKKKTIKGRSLHNLSLFNKFHQISVLITFI